MTTETANALDAQAGAPVGAGALVGERVYTPSQYSGLHPNLKGRPALGREVRKRIYAFVRDEGLDALFGIARDPQNGDRARVLIWCAEHVTGKTPLVVTGDPDNPLRVVHEQLGGMSSEQLSALHARVMALIGALPPGDAHEGALEGEVSE